MVTEIYDLEDDPFETNNLADNPDFKDVRLEPEARYQEYLDNLTPYGSD